MSGAGGQTCVNRVRAGFYLDSVALMRVSAELSARTDVADAALMIGSVSNRQILGDAGLLTDDGRQAGPNDLVIAVRAANPTAAEAALDAAAQALDRLANRSGAASDPAQGYYGHGLVAALEHLPDANLALISVPGEFAAREARLALQRGLNVMLFSDNVPLQQELALKQTARERGLIVMGPDCGTALLHGVPLAFANAIPRGATGVVAASGTGLQEFSVLLARAGGGVSHGIGVGGRDLHDAIGALSTLTALDWLADDAATDTVVLISKPPGAASLANILARLQGYPKPVIVCFIGFVRAEGHPPLPSGVRSASTLRQAAELAANQTIGGHVAVDVRPPADPARRWLRGLFSGGTLCAEAQVVLRGTGLTLASNAPIPGVAPIDEVAPVNDVAPAAGHRLLDLGADQYTAGRPHPMIEPLVRARALAQTLADPEVAAVLLDVVLGYGAHPDPAGAVVDALMAAGDPATLPMVIASVCGVDGDPQGYAAQVDALSAAGVVVAPSNAHAAELAARAVLRR